MYHANLINGFVISLLLFILGLDPCFLSFII